MFDTILIGFGVKIVTALVGAFAIWLFVRFLDVLTGVEFKSKLQQLDGMPFAVYNGLRLIAVAMFMGLTFN